MHISVLGTFTQESRSMIISDLDYKTGGRVLLTEPGTWIIKHNPGDFLEVHHENYEIAKVKKSDELDVVSGQMGIFDKRYYQDPQEVSNFPASRTPRRIKMFKKRIDWVAHRISYNELVLPHGTWMSIDDGAYPLFVGRDPNPKRSVHRVVRVIIVFDRDQGEYW